MNHITVQKRQVSCDVSMASLTAATAASSASTAIAPLPLDAAPFLVAEVGGSEQTQYNLYELTNAFVAGAITARSLIYRPDLTGQQWLPLASSHPTITAALDIPFVAIPQSAAATATTAGALASPSSTPAVWYYVDSQQQRVGPLTADSLHALHKVGSITDATLVWHDGLMEWLPWKQAALETETGADDGKQQQHDAEREESDDSGENKQEQPNSGHAAGPNSSDSLTTASEPQHNHRRKKRKKAPSAPTSIYATGLPPDTTVDEALQFFRKAGVIREDVKTNEKRIKLYRDEATGVGKGDATVNYMFSESVALALTLLDGAEIRPGWEVRVSEAKFEAAATGRGQQSGSQGTDRSEKRNKVETILAKRQKEVARSWQGDDSTFHSPLLPTTSAATTGSTSTSSSAGLRIVVLSHLFTPSEALAAADEQDSTDSFFEELISDIGCELEARCGEVDKMTVYEHNEDGVVVVKFKQVEAAERCVREMRGRRFGGREIGVEWWDGRDYSVRETAEEEKARLERFAAALEGDET